MGSMKQPAFRGKTLLGHSLLQALDSNLEEVILVLGHRFAEMKKTIPAVLFGDRLRIVRNRNYSKGLSTSIIGGLDAVGNRYNHVMILLADMPGVETKMIDLLMDRYLDSGLPVGAISAAGRAVSPAV